MVTTSTVPVRLQNIFHELPRGNARIPFKLLHEMGFIRPPQGKGNGLDGIPAHQSPQGFLDAGLHDKMAELLAIQLVVGSPEVLRRSMQRFGNIGRGW